MADDDSINLVGREMCEECEAFLGKEHRIGCSKSGFVTKEQTAEKFTSVEHAEKEEPLIGIDPDTAQLVIDHITTHSSDPQHEKVEALVAGLIQFVSAAEEVTETKEEA